MSEPTVNVPVKESGRIWLESDKQNVLVVEPNTFNQGKSEKENTTVRFKAPDDKKYRVEVTYNQREPRDLAQAVDDAFAEAFHNKEPFKQKTYVSIKDVENDGRIVSSVCLEGLDGEKFLNAKDPIQIQHQNGKIESVQPAQTFTYRGNDKSYDMREVDARVEAGVALKAVKVNAMTTEQQQAANQALQKVLQEKQKSSAALIFNYK